ncbi:MAG: Asp-tRNA(Asn)/Glu-tRNA(Gln) amidotransferase subunit GatC [Candidatus Pacebacteria bacterium]|nr:Asp-tRNA(Asn)/Glu-tRNA(Gln) amidotransferase subunit GatC [Candidatus Paceibacterota bacterium]
MTKITKKDVDKLTELSRVEMSDAEKNDILKDLESILGYVSEIQEVATKEAPAKERIGMLRNVMREDEDPNKEGIYTTEMVESAPKSEGDHIKVKKILQ